MKTKNKELKNKPIDEDGYPTKRWEICFMCGKKFCLTFSFAQQNYSQKHFWFHWTKKEENREKFVDNFCLRDYYFKKRKEFLRTVDPERKARFRSYLARNII